MTKHNINIEHYLFAAYFQYQIHRWRRHHLRRCQLQLPPHFDNYISFIKFICLIIIAYHYVVAFNLQLRQ